MNASGNTSGTPQLTKCPPLVGTGVGHLPRLMAPIPDAEHPSDHLPVSARLVLRPHWARVEVPAP